MKTDPAEVAFWFRRIAEIQLEFGQDTADAIEYTLWQELLQSIGAGECSDPVACAQAAINRPTKPMAELHPIDFII